MTTLDKAIQLLEAVQLINDKRLQAAIERECRKLEADIADSERFLAQLRGQRESES